MPRVASATDTRADKLFAAIDALDVENKWPSGVHVNWKTGAPDGRPEKRPGKHTHCSAFVAAAALEVGIYILRPPEHSQILLANAQFDWLLRDGGQYGWRQLPDCVAAQSVANRGEFVVVAYRNVHDDKPGHIALVRPSTKSEGQLREDGPDITQAGMSNYKRTTLKIGFSGHPRAFRENGVRYFSHHVDPANIP